MINNQGLQNRSLKNNNPGFSGNSVQIMLNLEKKGIQNAPRALREIKSLEPLMDIVKNTPLTAFRRTGFRWCIHGLYVPGVTGVKITSANPEFITKIKNIATKMDWKVSDTLTADRNIFDIITKKPAKTIDNLMSRFLGLPFTSDFGKIAGGKAVSPQEVVRLNMRGLLDKIIHENFSGLRDNAAGEIGTKNLAPDLVKKIKTVGESLGKYDSVGIKGTASTINGEKDLLEVVYEQLNKGAIQKNYKEKLDKVLDFVTQPGSLTVDNLREASNNLNDILQKEISQKFKSLKDLKYSEKLKLLHTLNDGDIVNGGITVKGKFEGGLKKFWQSNQEAFGIGAIICNLPKGTVYRKKLEWLGPKNFKVVGVLGGLDFQAPSKTVTAKIKNTLEGIKDYCGLEIKPLEYGIPVAGTANLKDGEKLFDIPKRFLGLTFTNGWGKFFDLPAINLKDKFNSNIQESGIIGVIDDTKKFAGEQFITDMINNQKVIPPNRFSLATKIDGFSKGVAGKFRNAKGEIFGKVQGVGAGIAQTADEVSRAIPVFNIAYAVLKAPFTLLSKLF